MKSEDSLVEDLPLLAVQPLIHRLVLASGERDKAVHTKTQLIIFIVLSLRDTLTMTEIAGYISSSREQATRAVAPLVDAGLVERSTDPENRTRIYIRLTDAGRTYWIQRERKIRATIEQRLDRSLSAEERRELERAAETMIELLKKVN